jgi:hypothetical protein
MSISLKPFTGLCFSPYLLKSFVSKGFGLYKKNDYKKHSFLGFAQLVHNFHNCSKGNKAVAPFVK